MPDNVRGQVRGQGLGSGAPVAHDPSGEEQFFNLVLGLQLTAPEKRDLVVFLLAL
ncbi:MAG TPA: hypothetical protein VML54_05680 [Candidatus Limnocylindrales bacterium]|nr:hypothetical protein [Candidatus Limnocylindrales bacterium]